MNNYPDFKYTPAICLKITIIIVKLFSLVVVGETIIHYMMAITTLCQEFIVCIRISRNVRFIQTYTALNSVICATNIYWALTMRQILCCAINLTWFLPSWNAIWLSERNTSIIHKVTFNLFIIKHKETNICGIFLWAWAFTRPLPGSLPSLTLLFRNAAVLLRRHLWNSIWAGECYRLSYRQKFPGRALGTGAGQRLRTGRWVVSVQPCLAQLRCRESSPRAPPVRSRVTLVFKNHPHSQVLWLHEINLISKPLE